MSGSLPGLAVPAGYLLCIAGAVLALGVIGLIGAVALSVALLVQRRFRAVRRATARSRRFGSAGYRGGPSRALTRRHPEHAGPIRHRAGQRSGASVHLLGRPPGLRPRRQRLSNHQPGHL